MVLMFNPVWNDEKPKDIQSIRLLHLGKFIEPDVPLSSCKIPTGETTIVHLVIKNPDDMKERKLPSQPSTTFIEMQDSFLCLLQTRPNQNLLIDAVLYSNRLVKYFCMYHYVIIFK